MGTEELSSVVPAASGNRMALLKGEATPVYLPALAMALRGYATMQDRNKLTRPEGMGRPDTGCTRPI
jgi:hypothetical protein